MRPCNSTCETAEKAFVRNRVLVEKPEVKRLLERPRHRREDNIEMDLQEIGWGWRGLDLAEDWDKWRAVVNTVMNLRVP